MKNIAMFFHKVITCGKEWKKQEKWFMDAHFFSGSSVAKLDEKNRFVLRQELRYGLIENGKLEFTLALGFGGGLVIYRNSEMQSIIEKFKKKIHQQEYQKFFTLFFSTLHPMTCDKLGRVSIPSLLKEAAGMKKEIIVAGVLNKIELWSKDVYDKNLAEMLQGSSELTSITQKAFSLLNDAPEQKDIEEMIQDKQSKAFAKTDL